MMRVVVHALSRRYVRAVIALARGGAMQATSFHRPASGHARAGIEVMP